ncbi:unnamed protein product [Penicillium salamii]|uniref:Uncharacterized protein n=1 Tax=Penicillium salamii TaxID=1612424 RepID=A0A9W4K061_9EURO|nr:unnamed protein product [Penicillium salamii]CAG8193842.1 unnamed protein product [Penicillium salamii]CAG8306764.1 unnamed protein product [Penicillium salamii]CAG8360417.1 unnamed protein product [Penicillium salamii]CAG8405956.1 unnamed protein product [Penicillium salamii]
MCDVPFFPILPICFQCGTDQNPCHCKVVGPTLGMCPVPNPGHLNPKEDILTSAGFCATVVSAVFCWPLSIFCGCGCTKAGKDMLGYPVKLNGQVSNAIPF